MHINMWNDSWLWSHDTPYVDSPHIEGRKDLRLGELIDPINKV